jgi:glyoxylase-like metal-dependent hydrolase (beta-lactamase superfamily II)
MGALMTPAVAIHALHCGSITLPRSSMVGGLPCDLKTALASVRFPLLAFAIELADRSYVLVDTAIDREQSTGLGWWRTALFDLASRMHTLPEWGFCRRMTALGIEPARVRCVLMTHFDYDHTGGLSFASDLPVHVSRAEWGAAQSPSLRDRITRRYAPSDYAGLKNVTEVEFVKDPAHPYVEGIAEIACSDGAVAMVSLPGHTIGHAGVLVRLEGGKRTLLCGDVCYLAEHVSEDLPLGYFPRAVAYDFGAVERSLDGLRRWKKAEPALRVVPSHDPATGALCAERPVRLGA